MQMLRHAVAINTIFEDISLLALTVDVEYGKGDTGHPQVPEGLTALPRINSLKEVHITTHIL